MDVENMLYSGIFKQADEELFKKIETALGFKLFFWQKSFISYGVFRRFGKTTAVCIRDLIRTELPPIDFTKRPQTPMEDLYRKEIAEMQKKLSAVGIETRKIRWPDQVCKRQELTEIKTKCDGCRYKILDGDGCCFICSRKEREDFYEPIV